MCTKDNLVKYQPNKSLSKRLRLNTISYGYTQVVTIAAQLLLVPFFLKYWGTDRYADWLVLTGIPTLLTLLDMGVSQASANKATALAGGGDIHGARQSMQTALAFSLSICFTILLVSITIAPLIDWNSILNLKTLTTSESTHIIIIMCLYLCTSILGGPLDGWYRTIDRTATGAFLLANRRMADIMISIVVLIFDGSPTSLATALLSTQVIALLVLSLIAHKLSPWPVLGLKSASLQEFKTIYKPALAYASFPLAQLVTLQGGLQILNQVAPPQLVVGYVMARTLMRMIIQLGVVINNALKPEISRQAGKGDLQETRKLTNKITRWVLFVCILAYATLVFIGPYFITLWGHGKVQVGRFELFTIGLHTIVNVAWFIPAALLIATNKHARLAGVYSASSLLSIVIWISCSKSIDPIAGAAMTLTIPELATAMYYYISNRKPT